MAILDLVEGFMGLLDIATHWRFFLATAVGIGIGVGVYFVAGETPDTAAVGAAISVAGAVCGLIWQSRAGRP